MTSHQRTLTGTVFTCTLLASIVGFGLAVERTASAQSLVQLTELTASDGSASDWFAYSVATSGSTTVIGAYPKTIGSNASQGAAYVFALVGSNWVQMPDLVAGDGKAGDDFGWSVAISGNAAVIGAPNKTIGSNTSQGAAYVFAYNGANWVQQGSALTASDGSAGDYFGRSVAISGNTAVIGASLHNGGLGVAYVFALNGTNWVQQTELAASDGVAGDYFGSSVAISGNTALIGAATKTIGSNTLQGAAYVFVHSGSSWGPQLELTASDGATGDSFGRSVAISGNTAVIGASGKNSNRGAAYVFAYGGSWSQQAELTASDGASNDRFGFSVATSGNTALVGASTKTIGSNTQQGAAYVFTTSGSTWVQQGSTLTASDGAARNTFGYSVAISGNTSVIGSPKNTIGSNTQQGAAYVFGANNMQTPFFPWWGAGALGVLLAMGTMRELARTRRRFAQ